MFDGNTTRTEWRYGGCWEFRAIANKYGIESPWSGSWNAYLPGNDYPYGGNIYSLDPNFFVRYQCTSFAAWRIKQHHVPSFSNFWRMSVFNPWESAWWNASHWDTAANMAGVYTTSNPTVGSTLQADPGQDNAGVRPAREW